MVISADFWPHRRRRLQEMRLGVLARDIGQMRPVLATLWARGEGRVSWGMRFARANRAAAALRGLCVPLRLGSKGMAISCLLSEIHRLSPSARPSLPGEGTARAALSAAKAIARLLLWTISCS